MRVSFERAGSVSLARCALLALALLAVSACGVSGDGTSSPTSASLACTIQYRSVSTTVTHVTVTCTVRNAMRDQTSFTATYRIGKEQATEAMCSGALRGGAGTCAIAFDEDAQSANPGSVTAELVPSHRTLGPVTPTVV